MLKKIKKKYLNFDKKTFFQVFGIEIGSLFLFLLLIFILTNSFVSIVPQELLSLKGTINSLEGNELENTVDMLKTYIWAFYTFLIIFLLATLFLLNTSRKLIYEKIINDKYSIKYYWKYFLFNTSITLVVGLIMFIIYFFINWFFGLIPYVMSKLNFYLQMTITQMIPLTILFYIFILICYTLNMLFFHNKFNFKKTFRSIRKISLSHYFLPAFVIYSIIFILSMMISFIDNFILAMVWTVLSSIFLIMQLAYFKFLVKQFNQ